MRPGNLHSGAGQLKDAAEKLHLAWMTAREAWNDHQAIEFEEEVLTPLFDAVRGVMPAIDQMSVTMNTATRSCEE